VGIFFDFSSKILENLQADLNHRFWNFLVESFDLSPEERLSLLLPFALESGRLSVQGGLRATPRMVAQLAELSYGKVREIFHPHGKLLRFRLIRYLAPSEAQPLLDRAYTLPEALLDRLTGLRPVLKGAREIPVATEEVFLSQSEEMASLVKEAQEKGQPFLAELIGPVETGLLVVEEVLTLLGLRGWEVSLEGMEEEDLGEILREALMEGRVVVLKEARLSPGLKDLLLSLGFLVFVLSPKIVGLAPQAFFLNPPPPAHLEGLYRSFGLEGRLPLLPLSRSRLKLLTGQKGLCELGLLSEIRKRARDLALVREPRRQLSDLVLPAREKELLEHLLLRIRKRHLVLEEWGLKRFAYPRLGTNVLFVGPPGTGKTLAAEALAHALGLPLVVVDLAAVTSKWVGETEKHLRQIFEDLVSPETVVVFDEAEALFGRRVEARQAQDRYANLEVSYLLQRMDDHQGLVILTTNFQPALDEAFLRRLDLIVRFPFPDEEARERLWRRFLEELPAIRGLNPAKLARKYRLNGAQIRNTVLTAAYLATQTVGPAEIEKALELEFEKLGAMREER